MSRHYYLFPILWVGLVGCAAAQVDQLPPTNQPPAPSQAPPRYDERPNDERSKEPGVSSSRDTRIDISPPKDDDKAHPNSAASMPDDDSSDVQEMHPWNPHKAAKDVEVGDFYFKRKNYRAALERYREALFFKNGDAIANFRMAESYAKLDDPDQARIHYKEYLKILPDGPLAKQAEKELQKLGTEKSQVSPPSQ